MEPSGESESARIRLLGLGNAILADDALGILGASRLIVVDTILTADGGSGGIMHPDVRHAIPKAVDVVKRLAGRGPNRYARA